MKRTIAVIATASILSGCAELEDTGEEGFGPLESWRARTILGGGDGQTAHRHQGQVVGAGLVEAGRGTIYPGRQPLFRDSDFVNSNGERTVSLNLVDVSVAEAAAAILGELLNENYVLDPGVSGTVNIRSSQPISRTTAIEVFELALKQNNAALVRRGEVFAITPISGDLTIGASTGPDVPAGYSIRVIPLNNIGAQEMAAILQPFAGSGIVGIDAQRNIIVLAGTSADQKAWAQTIASFDVDWLANRSVGIFPIRGRSAQSIINGLEAVVETDENFEPLAVFEIIPENNSILAVTKTPSALESVATWIKRLTRESTNDGQIYSYDMKYARAATVATTLAQVLGVQVETSDEEAQVVEASLADDAFREYNGTRIVASEATNTLLIYGTREEYERILGLLHRLDVPPRQVLVEATIVEVQLNDDLRYGVQYFFEDEGDTIGLTSGTTQAISPNLPGFSLVLNTPAEVVIDALDDVTEVNVVSSPNLMILNNESARLVVGDQVPITTRQATDATNTDTVFVNNVEFRDTGVIFEVTPRINSSGSVVLDINQEVSTVAESASDAETLTPTISQRTISSSVAVDSGETIALGGLFETSRSRGNSGVPVLKDIPGVGKLFGRTSKSAGQTELLVMITPRIVNGTMDARRVTRQLRNRVQRIRLDDASLSTAISVPNLATENSALITKKATDTPSASAELKPVARATQAAVAATPAVQQASATPQPAQAAAPRTAVSAAAAAPAAQVVDGAKKGDYFTYLGSFQNVEMAKAHWSRLQKSNPSALAKLEPRFAKAGALTAVAVGPFDQSTATGICVQVRTECYTARHQ